MSPTLAAMLGAVLLGLGAYSVLNPSARLGAGLGAMAAGVLLPSFVIGQEMGRPELLAIGGVAAALALAWSGLAAESE